MKKNLALFVILLFSFSTLQAQEKSNIASVSSKAIWSEGKTSGKFRIILPEGSVKEDVEKSASYYVHNFTVNYDSATRIAEISMVTNDERSRQIIVRFLSACGVQKINLEGTLIDLYPFYDTYLK